MRTGFDSSRAFRVIHRFIAFTTRFGLYIWVAVRGGLFLVIHLFGGLTAYAGELNNCYCVYKIDSGFIVN